MEDRQTDAWIRQTYIIGFNFSLKIMVHKEKG